VPKLGRCDWPVIFCQAGGGRVRNHPVRYIIDPDTAHTHTLNFRMGKESTNRVIPFHLILPLLVFLFGLLRQVILPLRKGTVNSLVSGVDRCPFRVTERLSNRELIGVLLGLLNALVSGGDRCPFRLTERLSNRELIGVLLGLLNALVSGGDRCPFRLLLRRLVNLN
jgi:hypothetical protein